ncbi:MAG: ATP-binding cassette domain-containing protein [Aggregatilineales bacterium]
MSNTLIQVNNLVKHFALPGGWLTGQRRVVHALEDVTIDIQQGEVLGLVGESGCGKTTLGRCILQLEKPTAGQVLFGNTDLTRLSKRALRQKRRDMQIVFQNPLASLSPRRTIQQSLIEPLQTHDFPKEEWLSRIHAMMQRVGLGKQHLDRYPHELSGGQLQRISVARALLLEPKLLVLDEPTSALDVSIQAQIINLLDELRHEIGLTYLFISHDLSVVEHLSDRIGVMYLGKLVEIGQTADIINNPAHPYTKALLQSVPRVGVSRDPSHTPLEGNVPSPIYPPSGCRFHTRCPIAETLCTQTEPQLELLDTGQWTACHFTNKETA